MNNFVFTLDAPRYCSQCKQKQPMSGGQHFPINQGRNQRWFCASCIANKKAKQQGEAK